jgi:copper oxidase (laccase) domain-containing protein
MHDRYGTNPQDILGVIGPSIGQHHYEVGQDVIKKVKSAFGGEASGLLLANGDGSGDEKARLDLWAQPSVLEECGVRRVRFQASAACNLEMG